MMEGLVVQMPAPTVHMFEVPLGKTLNPKFFPMGPHGRSHALVFE